MSCGTKLTSNKNADGRAYASTGINNKVMLCYVILCNGSKTGVHCISDIFVFAS